MTEKPLENLTAVVAMSENNAIAKDGHIPWDYPEDKKQYKQRVWGEPLIMGRKTYDAMTKYQSAFISDAPAIGVLTSDTEYPVEDDSHILLHSIEDAYDWIAEFDKEVYNLGGGTVYHQLFDVTTTAVVSHIPMNVTNPDVFFPTIDGDVWETSITESYRDFSVKTYRRR